MREANPSVAKRVIDLMPDRPSIKARQFLSTPVPKGEINQVR